MKNFYFYDLPRTGGTSFKHWARRCKAIKKVHYGDGHGWHHVTFKPRSEVAKLTSGDLFTFTILRDPIEHSASLYAKIRKHKHAYCPKLAGLSFKNWIHGIYAEDMMSSPAPWGFSMVSFYDPKTSNLDTAIKNIESMDFVCFTDRLNNDINAMLGKANAGVTFSSHRMNVASRHFEISNAERNVIRRVRAEDFKLVNHFRKKRGLPIYE
jgi:hypothetical protein